MSVQPFTMLGDSSLAAVRQVLERIVRGWATAWGVEAVPACACVRGEDAPVDVLPRWEEGCASRDGHFWLEATAGWHEDVTREVFHAEYAYGADTPASMLAPAVGAKADAELRDAIREALLPGATERVDAPGVGARRRGMGSVFISLRIGHQRCVGLLNAAAVRALVARTGQRQAPPALPGLGKLALGRALQDLAVKLPVELGRTQISLGTLLEAGVGDVIRLGTHVEEPVTICGPEGAAIIYGWLGRQGDRMAVELAGRIK